MKKARQFHFWIGLLASVFVFIESATGIAMYFGDMGEHRGRAAFFDSTGASVQTGDGSGQAGNGIDAGQSGQAGDDANQAAGGQIADSQRNPSDQANSGFNRGRAGAGRFRGEFGREAPGGISGLVRMLHTGIVGLISSIALFLLTGTGITMAIQTLVARRRRRGDAGQTPMEDV